MIRHGVITIVAATLLACAANAQQTSQAPVDTGWEQLTSEQRAVLGFSAFFGSVYRQFDFGHAYLPAICATERLVSTFTRFARYSRETAEGRRIA